MRALDLFCGSGGASLGVHNAGFDVVGVDIENQKYYPYEFVKCDVFDLPTEFFKDFDFIWASPPCQGYIFANRNKPDYPRLIEKTRSLLLELKKPFVIENVMGAPIRKDLELCGTMFGLKLLRHRKFEIEGFHVPQIKHMKHKGLLATSDYVACYSGAKGNPRTRAKYGTPKFTYEQECQAMNIHHVKNRELLYQCIPPNYSEYIIKHLVPILTL